MINAGQSVEKREPLYTVAGNVSWDGYYGKQDEGFLQKLKIELSCDLAIPLLGKYTDQTIIQKIAHTSMFRAALFTTDKPWKQPQCPSADECMNLEIIVLSEISHKENDKYHMISCICSI